MRTRTRAWIVPASLALGLALATPQGAAQAQAQETAPPPDTTQAEDVLRAMSQYLAKQKAYSYHAEVVFDHVLPGGPKIQLSGAVDVSVSRPDNLFVDYRDDVSDRVVWLDKGKLTLLDPVAGTYAEVAGPKEIDGMVAKVEKDYGLALPLGELAESDAYATLMRGVDLVHYVGVHDVEGTLCHHVVLQRPDLDLQVFVEVGEKPLPRKLVFDHPRQPGDPQYTAVITEWTLAPPAAGIFTPKVPEDAARVEFLPIAEAR